MGPQEQPDQRPRRHPPLDRPTQTLDDQHRWNTARRLLHDDTLKPDDRLAGLLVLLYAQTPAAICRMTIVDIETEVDPVRLHLGSSPIHLPEPVADLARLVTANRRARAICPATARRSTPTIKIKSLQIKSLRFQGIAHPIFGSVRLLTQIVC